MWMGGKCILNEGINFSDQNVLTVTLTFSSYTIIIIVMFAVHVLASTYFQCLGECVT